MQLVAEVHETPSRMLKFAPVGTGVVWMDQVLPSQRSARGTGPAVLV